MSHTYKNFPGDISLLLVKPDAVARNLIGSVIKDLTDNEFFILSVKTLKFSHQDASEFYDEHKEKPFFNGLCKTISSGTTCAIAVYKEKSAVQDLRDLIGATNPSDAKCGTLRFKHAKSLDENSVHGSDSISSSMREIGLIFSANSINMNLVHKDDDMTSKKTTASSFDGSLKRPQVKPVVA